MNVKLIYQELKRKAYLLKVLALRDFKTQYIQNKMGMAWVVLNPLFIVLLYTYVFSVVLRIRNPSSIGTSYALFLLSGMTPFLAISEVIHASTNCLTEKKTLLLKTVFPAEILPPVTVILSIIGETVTLVMVLAIALYESSGQSSVMWLALPLLVFIRVLFSLGISWWISILTVFIPDLRQALGLGVSAWMFLTPILYPYEKGPEGFKTLQNFNPLHIIVDAYRSIILEAQVPDMMVLSKWVLVFIVLNLSGYWLFKKLLSRAKDWL